MQSLNAFKNLRRFSYYCSYDGSVLVSRTIVQVKTALDNTSSYVIQLSCLYISILYINIYSIYFFSLWVRCNLKAISREESSLFSFLTRTSDPLLSGLNLYFKCVSTEIVVYGNHCVLIFFNLFHSAICTIALGVKLLKQSRRKQRDHFILENRICMYPISQHSLQQQLIKVT